MKKAQIKILFLLHMGFFSCSLLSVEKTLENKTFVDYTCEDYAVRSQDEKFALRHRAWIVVRIEGQPRGRAVIGHGRFAPINLRIGNGVSWRRSRL